MFKKLSFLSAFFTVFFVPMMALAAGDAAEEAAHAEPSPLFITILAVLSFVTIVYMVFLTVKDHG